MQAPVRVAQLERRLREEGRVVAVGRGHQRAAAAARERVRVVDVAIRHHRGDRPECLDLVHALRGVAVVDLQQVGHDEGPDRGIGVDQVGAPAGPGDGGFGGERGQAVAHRGELRAAGQRSHAHRLVARVADLDRGQRRGDGFGGCRRVRLRHQHAADRRAFLAGLDGHLARHFLHHQREGLATRRRVGPEQRAVQAVGLGIHADRMAQHDVVAADGPRRVGRAGEGHQVERLQCLDQAFGASAHDSQRALRQHAGGDHVGDHALRQPRGGGGRLDHHRHAREQRRGGLLPQPPGGEVEGVDEQRQAALRGEEVGALERAVLAQLHRRAVGQAARRAELRAPPGVLRERVERAVDVDRRIVAGGARVAQRDVVVGIALALQHLGDARKLCRTFSVGERAQCSAAAGARESEAGGQVEPCARDAHELGAEHRIEQRRAAAGARLPAALEVVVEQLDHGSASS